MKTPPRYTVVIQWDTESKCYVGHFPEWREHAYSHVFGDTYEECARNAGEVLELLMDDENDSDPIPQPVFFDYESTIPTTPAPRRKKEPTRATA